MGRKIEEVESLKEIQSLDHKVLLLRWMVERMENPSLSPWSPRPQSDVKIRDSNKNMKSVEVSSHIHPSSAVISFKFNLCQVLIVVMICCGECSVMMSDDKMMEIMLRSLSAQVEGSKRMDPLLRELMVTAVQRSQDERDKNNLTPPRYPQNPLLRQLRDNVVDNFADMVLQLPPRAQDHLLKYDHLHLQNFLLISIVRVLREEGMTDEDIVNILPPSARQNPLLRQLMSNVMEDFLSSLTPPDQRQNPLLRQLSGNSVNDDSSTHLSPPVYRQDPLLRSTFHFSEHNFINPLQTTESTT